MRALSGRGTLTAHPAAVVAQEPPMHAVGTYEITWFSVNTVTEQPTVPKLLLVLAQHCSRIRCALR
jgi:hypothetical protein